MGLIHKTKFVPFIDVSTTTTPSWKQIKKSTTFSMALNPQTKTFDFISSENPEEEIDSYQPALSQSLTMFDDEDDFKTIFDMVFNLPTGGEAHRNVLLAFYACKDTQPTTFALTSDEDIVAGKTYYTRSGTSPDYVYTPVDTPVKADLSNYYEATAYTTYYKAWKVDSVVKLGTLDSVNQSIDFDLALNEHETAAVTVTDSVPTWVPGTWSGDTFTPDPEE